MRGTRTPRTFGLGRPRFVPELPSARPKCRRKRTRIWSDAYWSERSGGRALLENLRRPWNSSPGTWHVPDRITGRDGKFPVFPEQLTRRGNTCSHRYRVYIPDSVGPHLPVTKEDEGQPPPTTHPVHELRNCRDKSWLCRASHYLLRRVSVYIATGSFELLHPMATSSQRGMKWTCVTTLAHLARRVDIFQISHFPNQSYKTNPSSRFRTLPTRLYVIGCCRSFVLPLKENYTVKNCKEKLIYIGF